jgi:uncharacterized membrane protein
LRLPSLALENKLVANPDAAPPNLPAHIEDSIRSIAQHHAEYHEKATPLQRAVERVTDLLGRPMFIGVLTLVVIGWIGSNLLTAALGHRAVDPPPFTWLTGAISLVSLYMVVMILATQRREDQLARERDLLMLELAIQSEQKTAKLIQLLEESRRDNPLIHDRVDPEADAMAQPADPQSVLAAIKETHAKTGQAGGPVDGS